MMKIVASAIKVYPKGSEYPIIVCGKRHCNYLETLWNSKIEIDKSKNVQGFITEFDVFLDRYQAAEAAWAEKQILPESETYKKMAKDAAEHNGQFTKAYTLFSEDLW